MIDNFDVEIKWPDWYTPTATNSRQNRNVLLRRHPMGMHLANNGETCGTCANLKTTHHGGTYFKCAKARQSACAATDTRKKWAACDLWERAP